MKSDDIGAEHPPEYSGTVTNMYPNYIKPTFHFEYVCGMPVHSFCGKDLPRGYFVDKEGTKKHIGINRGHKKITPVLCTIWDISRESECSIPKTVVILFFNNMWDTAHYVTTTYRDATDARSVVQIMRDAGAGIINQDGTWLVEYFRDCIDLRVIEARQMEEI